uniref:Uncharacterized protein n=1 Tax=Gasterosteus aculeatus TaxID=69293 RepID=G3NC55_GASAC
MDFGGILYEGNLHNCHHLTHFVCNLPEVGLEPQIFCITAHIWSTASPSSPHLLFLQPDHREERTIRTSRRRTCSSITSLSPSFPLQHSSTWRSSPSGASRPLFPVWRPPLSRTVKAVSRRLRQKDRRLPRTRPRKMRTSSGFWRAISRKLRPAPPESTSA